MQEITFEIDAQRVGRASGYLGGLTVERYTFTGATLPAGTRLAILTRAGVTIAAAEITEGNAATVDTNTQEVADLLRYQPLGACESVYIALGDADTIIALIPAVMRKNWLDDEATHPPAPVNRYPTKTELDEWLARFDERATAAETAKADAQEAAAQAAQRATAAQTAKTAAESAATAAQTAQGKAEAAQAAAEAAQEGADAAQAAAAQSATAAAQSAQAAAENVTALLQGKVEAAESAKAGAEAAQTAAETAKAGAEDAQTAAASSATAAANSAAAAKQSADLAAQEAAENVTALLQGKVDAAESAKAGAETAQAGAEAAAMDAATSYADTAAIMKNQEYLEIPNMSSLPSYSLAGNTLVKRIRQSGGNQANLAYYLMACCFNLEEFNVADDIWSWGEGVFSNCWKLKTITSKRKNLQACSRFLFDQCYELSPAYVASLCYKYTKNFLEGCCRDLGKNLAEAEPFDLGVSIERTFAEYSLYGAKLSYFRAKIVNGTVDYVLGNNTTLKEIDLTFSSSTKAFWGRFLYEARGLEKFTFRTSEATSLGGIGELFASNTYNGANSSVVDIYFQDWTQAVAESHFNTVGLGATSSKYHFHYSDTPEGEYITYA